MITSAEQYTACEELNEFLSTLGIIKPKTYTQFAETLGDVHSDYCTCDDCGCVGYCDCYNYDDEYEDYEDEDEDDDEDKVATPIGGTK